MKGLRHRARGSVVAPLGFGRIVSSGTRSLAAVPAADFPAWGGWAGQCTSASASGACRAGPSARVRRTERSAPGTGPAPWGDALCLICYLKVFLSEFLCLLVLHRFFGHRHHLLEILLCDMGPLGFAVDALVGDCIDQALPPPLA